MHLARTFPLTVSLANACIALGTLLTAALVPVSSAGAQIPQAIYPLNTDLLEATATYGPVVLTGNPTPPSPPSAGTGVCVNGIYAFSSGGQNAQTPTIVTLDQNDFQIDLEFNITALPSSFQSPVLMAGNGWRWIGLYVQANGTVGLKYNNSLFTWSSTLLTAGPWYTASIRYEAGSVEVFINGVVVHTAALGALNTNNNYNFTTNDFSNGRSHYGCIRNLAISNDTTLGSTATTTVYGSGCDGLVLGATGLPTIGNALFETVVSNVPIVSPIAFVGFGSLVVNPGIDLGPLGMAGCFSHTSLDLGLFGPSVVSGTSASFPLPIPPSPSLAGALLAAQGVSLSAATALGIASSNGLQLILGF